jgi:hypothetical protein
VDRTVVISKGVRGAEEAAMTLSVASISGSLMQLLCLLLFVELCVVVNGLDVSPLKENRANGKAPLPEPDRRSYDLHQCFSSHAASLGEEKTCFDRGVLVVSKRERKVRLQDVRSLTVVPTIDICALTSSPIL